MYVCVTLFFYSLLFVYRPLLQQLLPPPQLLSQQLVPVSRTPSHTPSLLIHTHTVEFDQFLAHRASKGEELPASRPRPQMQAAEERSDELFQL